MVHIHVGDQIYSIGRPVGWRFARLALWIRRVENSEVGKACTGDQEVRINSLLFFFLYHIMQGGPMHISPGLSRPFP
jgi:hypothetical protein